MTASVYHPGASSFDEELLESGMFSDIKVICKDKTWLLHRVIVATRCPYFEAQAADDSVVKIEDFTPVPSYLKEDLDPASTLTELTICLDLFALGKHFLLEGLRNLAIDLLTEKIIVEANEIQASCRKNDTKTLPSRRFPFHFLRLVRAVYNGPKADNFKELRPVLMLYLKLTRYLVLRDEIMGNELRTDKELAGFLDDILKETLFRPLFEDKAPLSMPTTCNKCGKALTFATRFGDATTGKGHRAWCRECQPLGRKNVMDIIVAAND
ncbi:hypothetical protein F4808DRAFT_474673 [Astrocystis sublimbata]|nr:hypothetical protein F4808DRAFT_474673 [Astrocystis sublimbata]